ncbi:YolD-like family protein (plasmid) [Bacillus mycoides]|nr:YolD-like family protein [Bacillus mycoides]
MNNANIPKGMIKWNPFEAMPEQFAGIIKQKTKVERPILTPEEKEQIENLLLCSLLSEEELLITYYEDGHLLTNHMTVMDIDPLNSAVICTDAYYNKNNLKFINIVDVKQREEFKWKKESQKTKIVTKVNYNCFFHHRNHSISMLFLCNYYEQ